jgi:hypothetical protein
MRGSWLLALIPIATCAQSPDGSLSGLVKIDTAAVESRPNLNTWQNAHSSEKRIEPSYSLIEYESQNMWCAATEASITLANGITVSRLALFYEPVLNGPLPARVDKSLTNQCELLAFWYQVDHLPNPREFIDAVTKELSQAWGPFDAVDRQSRFYHGWGTGYWEAFVSWERANASTIVAFDPRGNVPPSTSPRVMVITRSPQLPSDQSLDIGGGYKPKGQPPLPQQAEDETTRVAHLEDPCFFEGKSDWRIGLAVSGEQFLRDYPASRWAPYVHLILGRTYGATLLLTYPGGDMESNPNHGALDPVQLRDAAVLHYRSFLAQKPNDPDVSYARHELWRLAANLPPTAIHFACVD